MPQMIKIAVQVICAFLCNKWKERRRINHTVQSTFNKIFSSYLESPSYHIFDILSCSNNRITISYRKLLLFLAILCRNKVETRSTLLPVSSVCTKSYMCHFCLVECSHLLHPYSTNYNNKL